MQALNVSGGRALGGKMATIGFGMRSLGIPYRPYHSRGERHTMRPDVAASILEIIAETGWSGATS